MSDVIQVARYQMTAWRPGAVVSIEGRPYRVVALSDGEYPALTVKRIGRLRAAAMEMRWWIQWRIAGWRDGR